jgi:hypothetical protein
MEVCFLIGELKIIFVPIFKKKCWITAENALKEETGKTLNK